MVMEDTPLLMHVSKGQKVGLVEARLALALGVPEVVCPRCRKRVVTP